MRRRDATEFAWRDCHSTARREASLSTWPSRSARPRGEQAAFARRDLADVVHQVFVDQAVEVPGEDGEAGGVVGLPPRLGEPLVGEVGQRPGPRGRRRGSGDPGVQLLPIAVGHGDDGPIGRELRGQAHQPTAKTASEAASEKARASFWRPPWRLRGGRRAVPRRGGRRGVRICASRSGGTGQAGTGRRRQALLEADQPPVPGATGRARGEVPRLGGGRVAGWSAASRLRRRVEQFIRSPGAIRPAVGGGP